MNKNNVVVTREDAKAWNIYIAVPCYGGEVTEPFFISMVETLQMFNSIGCKFSINTIQDSLISRARNLLVAKFLASKDSTHILFIDADIGFDPREVLKLLVKDKDIITGSYPIKEVDWAQVKVNADAGVHQDRLLEQSVRFVTNFKPDDDGVVQLKDGLIEVYDAGTGFMLIKREAFMRLIDAYPELKFIDDGGALSGDDANYSYAFFNSYIDENGRFLSEDYGFCRYWQKIGGQIFVEPTIRLTHVGKLKFQGALMNSLRRSDKK